MKRSFLMLIASWIAIASSAATMPNIVVILSDDVGYGDISCNNPQSLIQTPAIDALAKAGRRFTEAHSPAAVCSPTRYGLLTGRYAWRTAMKEGVLYDFDPALIKKGRTTVASLLKSAGYHTAAFGKWHVGLDWTPKEGDPGDWQWGQIVRYNAQVAVSRIDMTKPLRNGPIDLGFDTFYGGLSQGVSRYYVQDDLVTGDKIPRDDMDNVFVAKSEAFLRDHLAKQKSKPFFLYLALGAAHVPLTPPANLKGKSKTGPLGDMVMWVDQSVSRITTLLDELHIADNTLLIFTSDNGSIMHADNAKAGHQPSAGRRGYKTDIWDGGTHVPFIARWPGRIPAGTESHALVCLVDLLATFAAITGQDIPAWHGEDSFNILPALTGDDQTGRSELITHSYTGIFAIRDHEWKMILGTQGSGGHQGITAGWQPNQGGFDRTSATDIGQLYRVNDDPGEKGDLWSQHPDVVKRMRDRVDLLQRQGWSVRPPP
ncbi:MAG: arylsulfatase [Verrucomicrobiaceae bacterium]